MNSKDADYLTNRLQFLKNSAQPKQAHSAQAAVRQGPSVLTPSMLNLLSAQPHFPADRKVHFKPEPTFFNGKGPEVPRFCSPLSKHCLAQPSPYDTSISQLNGQPSFAEPKRAFSAETIRHRGRLLAVIGQVENGHGAHTRSSRYQGKNLRPAQPRSWSVTRPMMPRTRIAAKTLS